jgi:hypothetical protein
MIEIFYRNISSCVLNNNFTSQYIPIGRGVRQGDPLSSVLFVIAIEILNIRIREENAIDGIRFCNEEIKVLNYADDTTAVLSTIDDAKRLLKLCKEFSAIAGLKINNTKSEGMWIGKDKNHTDKPLGIKWPGKLKVLGVFVSYDTDVVNENFRIKLAKLKTNLNMWKRRKLTIGGKIMVVKTFGISQMLYLSAVLKTPEWVLKEMENVVYEFLWSGRQHKVKTKMVIQEYKDGGFKMCDFVSMDKIQKLKWIRRFKDDHNSPWKTVFRSLMKTIDVDTFVLSPFHKNEIPKVSEFWQDVLSILYEIRKPPSVEELYNEMIWYNRCINIKGKTFYCKKLVDIGFMRVHQLFNDNGDLIDFKDLPEVVRSKTNFLYYNSICKSLPTKKYENVVKYIDASDTLLTFAGGTDLLTVHYKVLYNELVRRKLEYSKAVHDYSTTYDIPEEMWTKLFQLPFVLKLSNTEKEFQYKITHGYLATNRLLYKMNIIDSPRCNFCNLYSQSIKHMLWECLPVRSIWFQLEKMLLNKTNIPCTFIERDIILGIPLNPGQEHLRYVNRTVFTVKYRIYACKLNNEQPTFAKLTAGLI